MPEKHLINATLMSALQHFFDNPANHEAGASVVNGILVQIEATGRKQRFTADDFRRLALSFEVHHVAGPLALLERATTVPPPQTTPTPAVLNDIAERTREKANGPRNDPNHLPEASVLMVKPAGQR
jgi:hypothetical protein